LTQYTDTAAPVQDPAGVHATSTRTRPTIDDDAHTIMINRVAWDTLRPRALDVPTAPKFTLLKRQVLNLIREETMRALADAPPLGPTGPR
jgi:hypothetical protein